MSTEYTDLAIKLTKICSVAKYHPSPLRELTVFPRPLAGLLGSTSKREDRREGREGERCKGMGRNSVS